MIPIAAMSFPLFAETYKVGRRIYRRNPFQGGSRKRDLVDETGDTPDLYADEAEDGPSCAAPARVSPPPAVSKPKVKAAALKATVVVESKEAPPPLQNDPMVCEEDERVSFLNGKWMASISVPSSLVSCLIGTRGSTRREMEESTGCRLTIPRKGQEGPVEVKSFTSLESVQRCLDRIEILVDDARKQARFTHFAAVPCNHVDIVETFEIFRESILSSDLFPESVRGASLFPKANRLHLTISMLTLLDSKDMERVKKVMEQVEVEICVLLAGAPLVADIQGVSIMNDDPANCDVLYANIIGDNLQMVSDLILKRLVEAGLSAPSEGVNASDRVKLHMTLMNSRYRAQAEHARRRHSFDASSLLEEFGEFYFGTVLVDRISICALQSANSTEYYQETCPISFT